MSANRIQIYQYFQTGDIPTEAQFQFLFNSIWFKDEKMAISDVAGLDIAIQNTASAQQLQAHFNDSLAHAGTLALLDGSNLKTSDVNAWKNKLNINYLATVDGDIESGNVFTKEQIQKLINDLKVQDDEALFLLEELRAMLTSDDINLDELQEIVTYIKQNREQIELLQEVIIGSTQDDKIKLMGDYSLWGAVTLQNQFNDIVYEKVHSLEEITGTGKIRHQEQIRANSTITHNLNTYDFVIDAYDTVTMYTLPIKVRRAGLNAIDVEFDSPPQNFINITIRKI